ncbi:MAG: isoprenylcysteine carboxylmethyltransferase family protein [Pseudomonadota bacterium]|nr:isoprenylcysteine carboxylmethyltransferase family protein [Pseudomonadota bacterium]
MRKIDALIGSAVFLLAAPGTVGVLVPWLMTQWARESAGYSWAAAPGLLLIALGAAGLLETFLRFALTGEGTPAPVAPTRRLVVSGLYRHVRNPMYVCVLALILGQALFFGSATLIAYATVVWLAFHIFVVFFEERRLAREFGDAYAVYRRHVPRWIPRLTPWRPETGA